jgi:asparagine synthase (glutamine-hydrolysing)
MFSLALYDKSLNKTFLVRDRLGIKPLYYYCCEEFIGFSSEIRSLLDSGLIPRKLDSSRLYEYMAFQTVYDPNTLVENIKSLEAGCYLEIDHLKLNVNKSCWWDMRTERRDMSRSEARLKLKEIFYSAVETRLTSDVPFGAFLSGGIDSSAIVGAMSDISSEPIETFNVSFAEEEFSEAKYARIISEINKTRHHEIQLSPDEFLKLLPQALGYIDHPSGDGLNTWIVSRAIKEQGITMALSGLGGDELFGGYSIFRRMKYLNAIRLLWLVPTSIRENMGNMISSVAPSVYSQKVCDLLSMGRFDLRKIHSISREVLHEKQISQLLNESEGKYKEDFCSSVDVNFIFSETSVCELSTYMRSVLLRDSDQMSMAHSLELRVPFLDHRLVEFALSLPDHLKSYPKRLLVESLKDKLPDVIVNRPKMGFVFPWQYWLKNELYSFSKRNMELLSQRTYFDESSVLSLWGDFMGNNPKVNYSRIWPLVVLNHWMERNGIN